MSQKLEIYKCSICGHIVQIVHSGAGTLVCCGKEMQRIEENTVEASTEKHIPVLAKVADGYEVKVGEVEHPSEESHYIEWIELVLKDGQNLKKFINPGEKPAAQFKTGSEVSAVKAYCNLHGLWKA